MGKDRTSAELGKNTANSVNITLKHKQNNLKKNNPDS